MEKPAVLKNRWLRLLSVCAAVYFSTTWYYGWQYIYRFLMNDGVYSWLCAECDENYPGWNPELEVCVSQAEHQLYVCMEQETRVQALYTLIDSFVFIGGLLAGILYDFVGYRTSFVIGYAMHLFGFFGMAFSSKSYQLYIPAAICAGLSVNTVAFPGYYITNFFPGKEAFALNLNLGTQWAGSSIYYIFSKVQASTGTKLTTMVPIFAMIGLPFCMLYLITMPKNAEATRVELMALGIPCPAEPVKGSLKDAFTVLKQWDIAVYGFCVLPLTVLASNAYMTDVLILGGEEVSLFLGTIQVWQFLIHFGIAFIQLLEGWLMFWTPFAMIWIGAVFGLLSLVVGVDNQDWKKAAAFIFILGNTYLYAQKYVLCSKVVDPALFGMVVGGMALFTGAIQMTNIYWRQLAADAGGGDDGLDGLRGFIWGYLGIAVISGTLMCFIAIRITRGKLDHLRHVVTPVLAGEDGKGVLYEYYYYEKEVVRNAPSKDNP